MALLPYLPTTWDLKNVETFEDPTVRCVGCFLGGKPWYQTFMADDEWYLGYQTEIDPSVEEVTMDKYLARIEEIQVGDVLIMSHRNGAGGGTIVRAVGIVLYHRDLPVMDNGLPTDQTYRVFKVAWTNRNLNLQLSAAGPMDRKGSISKGYPLSELVHDIIPNQTDVGVTNSFLALFKEIKKARMRFLRLSLNIQPRAY